MKCESDGGKRSACVYLGSVKGGFFQISMFVGIVLIHGNIYRSLSVMIGYGYHCSWRYRLKEFVI